MAAICSSFKMSESLANKMSTFDSAVRATLGACGSYSSLCALSGARMISSIVRSKGIPNADEVAYETFKKSVSMYTPGDQAAVDDMIRIDVASMINDRLKV